MAIHQVTLINEERGIHKVLQVPEEQYILEAAEDAGMDLPYSCRTGTCSSCAGRVVSGAVDQSEQSLLDDDQVARGLVLTCVARPLSDCTIRTHQEDAVYE